MIYSDIYKALTLRPSDLIDLPVNHIKCENNGSVGGSGAPGSCTSSDLSIWLVSIYLVGNTALSLLNFYWFTQMIKAIRKRFVPGAPQTKKVQ